MINTKTSLDQRGVSLFEVSWILLLLDHESTRIINHDMSSMMVLLTNGSAGLSLSFICYGLILEPYIVRVVYVINNIWPVPLLYSVAALQISLRLHRHFGGFFLHQSCIRAGTHYH